MYRITNAFDMPGLPIRLKTKGFDHLVKKKRLQGKKVARIPLRPPAVIRRYPLTGGAEANDGAPDGPQGNETHNKPEATRRGAPKKLGRIQSILSLTLFDIGNI